MLKVLAQSWPLLLGVMLLMVGNGVQGSLLGVRGAHEGFTTFELSVIMSSYFVGFLGGSRLAPEMIRRVGHVRVFSALGSMISAVLILFPMVLDVYAWSIFRVLIGFCFSGIYVTAESWLNNTASNETRGRALSAYMIVQMLGIIASQGLLSLGDPTGYGLFIIPSVLVSLAFMPLLLADTPAPGRMPSGEGRPVLVVDDNVDAAQMLALQLQLAGYAVDVVHGGRATLDACAQRHYFACLIDMGLPDLHGTEVAARLTAGPAPVPLLVAVSGYGQPADLRTAREAGFDQYFVKPVDIAPLTRLLHERAAVHP